MDRELSWMAPGHGRQAFATLGSTRADEADRGLASGLGRLRRGAAVAPEVETLTRARHAGVGAVAGYLPRLAFAARCFAPDRWRPAVFFAADFAVRFDLRSLAVCLLPASGRADFVFRGVFAVPLCCPAGT